MSRPATTSGQASRAAAALRDGSARADGDASSGADEPSLAAAAAPVPFHHGEPGRVPVDVDGHKGRICAWCAGPIRPGCRRDAIYCGVVCRKRAWRFGQAVPTRSRPGLRDASRGPGPGSPGRFAYADPPYPGKAGYYDERQEVDHASLLEQLVDGWPDGWALSTSAQAVPEVLRMCPVGIRVCAWRRQVRPTRSRRPLSAWEPLLVYAGRELPTDRPQEVIDHLDYRGRYDSYPGALIGMKPPEFAVWMFAQLGALPGDTLDDLFPGSGAITRAWALYTSPGPKDTSRRSSVPPPPQPNRSTARNQGR